MPLYRRKKSFQLNALRALLIVMVLFLIYFIKYGLSDYAFLIGLALILVSIFPITEITINSRSVILVQFYLFGCFPKKLKLSKEDNIKMEPVEIQMSDPGDPIDSQDFLSNLTAGAISNTFSYKKYQFKKITPTGRSRRILVKLSQEEVSRLETFFQQTHGL